MELSSARSKRRRLMLSYVSPRRPDLPATFESLNDDTLTTILEFVGRKSYATYAGINKRCKEVYFATKGMTKETFLFGYGPLSAIKDKFEIITSGAPEFLETVGAGVVRYNRRDVMDWAVEEKNKQVLHDICNVAAREKKIDLLDEVWNSVEDEEDEDITRCVFQDVDYTAALYDKLEVMKWIEDKGIVIDKEYCAETAATLGHLDIIQWLYEEQGLELYGALYFEVIIGGGHLHVMKWLREQEVPWYRWNFHFAAKKGNLDILQWLHDESCPWPNNDTYRVGEYALKPEVVEWCRGNGYGDRIV
eukprot:CAMPEP_0178952664 /NCGR_PEP_ID=MMETSP0789-20121207/7978_1 /TAXON_ID=3005 /ORGANISM="Rhizosolenia setigera, Strain CCMP 1694" /LENGTH=304 /DNA_ID=CAMNT_0020633815 /DNA_START=22 /DNA_END=932 /DNA_ORIENTATION=+